MEVTAYVLGMLTIVLVAMLSVIVVGIVKIVKLQKQVKELNFNYDRSVDTLYRVIEETRESLHRRISEVNGETWRQFELTGKDITMVEKTIMNQIDKTRKEIDQDIDQLHRINSELNENARRYTDSRIDKLIDTYFDMVGSKKLIKG
jgi:methyl-accepting chemotaxis protein